MDCKVGTRISRFLIDTGSAVTIVPKEFASSHITPSLLKLTAANGSTIRNYGTTVLELGIRKLRRSYTWRCLVAEVVTPIIGADFLTHYGIIVDCKRSKLIDSSTNVVASAQLCLDENLCCPIRA